MNNLKILALLKSMQPDEVLSFRKYLKLTHPNEQIALSVFEYIRKLHPSFPEGKKLSMAYAYHKIFKEELDASKHNRKKLLNALSDLHLWLKDFLLKEKAGRDSLEQQVLWLSILKERGLKAEFLRHSTRFYEENVHPPRDINDCWKGLLSSYFYYQNLDQPMKELINLPVYNNLLGVFLESIQLRMAVETTTLQKVRPDIASSPTTTNFPVTPPLLLMYRALHQLVETEQPQHFNELQSLVFEHVEILDAFELHNFLKYLYNYAASQIRNGHETTYGKALHQLNLFGLQHNFFLRKGLISAPEFANIVNVAARAKDFSWANKFILEQKIFLRADIREDTILLAEAQLLFEQQRFEETLQLLRPTEFKDAHLYIRSKTLAIRCSFALAEDEDTLLETCAHLEGWLSRRRKPKTGAVEATLAFIRICKLIVLKKTSQKALLTQIRTTSNLYYREWLLTLAKDYEATYAPRNENKGGAYAK